MKLYQLQYFTSVCGHSCNISRAAEALHISQPSVSNAIRDLKEEFGVCLFQRINRKLRITREGEIFLAMATDLLSRSESVVNRMRDLGDRKNHVKIGIPPMIGSFLFPVIFQEFSKLHPEIRLEAFEEGSFQLMKMVEEDLLDAAIITMDQSDMEHFYAVRILDTETVFCVRRDHPLASRQTISFPQLAGEPLVLLRAGSYQHQMIEESFRRCGVIPNVVFHTNQLYTMENFLRTGIASVFLFRETAARMTGVQMISLDPPLEIHVGLVWKRGHFLYSDATRFIRFVKGKSYLPLLTPSTLGTGDS